jgi:hypothetical protein
LPLQPRLDFAGGDRVPCSTDAVPIRRGPAPLRSPLPRGRNGEIQRDAVKIPVGLSLSDEMMRPESQVKAVPDTWVTLSPLDGTPRHRQRCRECRCLDHEGSAFPTMEETTAVPQEIVLVVVTRCFRRPRDACR